MKSRSFCSLGATVSAQKSSGTCGSSRKSTLSRYADAATLFEKKSTLLLLFLSAIPNGCVNSLHSETKWKITEASTKWRQFMKHPVFFIIFEKVSAALRNFVKVTPFFLHPGHKVVKSLVLGGAQNAKKDSIDLRDLFWPIFWFA